MTVRVALIGCGTWGWNLLRVLRQSPRAELVAVADVRPSARVRAEASAAGIRLVGSLDDALALGLDAVVLATPAHTHAALAIDALDAGVDVFVEKPLAMSALDAERCAARARARGRVGMVGHLLLYHPVVERVLELARSGGLGALVRVEAERLSPAGDRSAPTLWTLGPHDLSVLHALDPSPIRDIAARGPESGDEARVSLVLETGLGARVALSRVHPSKERKITVIGEERAAIFDDVRAPDRVIFGRVERRRGGELVTPIGEERVPFREPLALEIDHFLGRVLDRAAPRSSFEEGAIVVRALERAEHAMIDERPAEAPASLFGGDPLPAE